MEGYNYIAYLTCLKGHARRHLLSGEKGVTDKPKMIGTSIVSFKSVSLVRNSSPTQETEVLEGHLKANEVSTWLTGCTDMNRYCLVPGLAEAAASLSRD